MEKHDYMNKDVAKYLISEFERQFATLPLDEKKRSALVEALETTPILESSRFYEEPSKNQKYTKRQIFDGDPDRKGYLLLTRIMRNKNADNLKEGLIKRMQESMTRKLDGYSSNIELRHVRKEEAIVKMMLERAKTEQKLDQLSILFRYQQEDFEGSDESPLTICIDRPIIVIPRATSGEISVLRAYEEKEGTAEIIEGKGRKETVTTMSYADYLKDRIKSA